MTTGSWTHVDTPEEVSVPDAITEVFANIRPSPVGVAATLTAFCSVVKLRTLTTRHEFVAFLHLVQAAVHIMSPSPRTIGEIRDALSMFCHRRGLRLDGIG